MTILFEQSVEIKGRSDSFMKSTKFLSYHDVTRKKSNRDRDER